MTILFIVVIAIVAFVVRLKYKLHKLQQEYLQKSRRESSLKYLHQAMAGSFDDIRPVDLVTMMASGGRTDSATTSVASNRSSKGDLAEGDAPNLYFPFTLQPVGCINCCNILSLFFCNVVIILESM